MAKYYDSVHLTSDQKDLLITQLKAEIFEQMLQDPEFQRLNDKLYTLQQKYRHCQDEKLMHENDLSYRNDQNDVTYKKLQDEIEDLRQALAQKNGESGGQQAEIGAVRAQIAQIERDCMNDGKQNDQKGDEVSTIRKQRDELQYEYDKQKQEENQDKEELIRIRDAVSNKERGGQDNDEKIHVLDYDLYKAQQKQSDLDNIQDSKDFELKRVDDALEKAKDQLNKLKKQHAKLSKETQGYQRTLDGQLAHKSDLQRQADEVDTTNLGLTSHKNQGENCLKKLSEKLLAAKMDKKKLQKNKEELLQKNDDIQSQVYMLAQRHTVLNSQNKDLNLELDEFLLMDERVRDQLNRRERVKSMMQATDFDLCRSAKKLGQMEAINYRKYSPQRFIY